jgi:hypothetical protein
MNASAFSEPFTPRGVAAFARAGLGRLLLAQVIFALLAAAATACLIDNACFPVVSTAIENLPDNGQITSGQLAWSGGSFQDLAESHWLAFDVDLDHSGQFRSTADLQIEFGRGSLRVFSLFGYYADFYYPPDDLIQFNRPQLQPLWNAWHVDILFAIALAAIVALFLSWWILATLYFLPVWLLAFFTNRDLDLPASWKLCGAALLPGALLMTAGIFLYGLGFYGLITFAFIFAAHFILGWLYLLFALPFFARTAAAPTPGNPFKTSKKS